MREKAVIDRFEGQQAVLLLGDGSRRLTVPRSTLPEGAREGDWLQVELDGDELSFCRVDRQETADAQQRIQDKLERLRRGEHRKPTED